MNADKFLKELEFSAAYIQSLKGKTFVVKAGGDVLDSDNTLQEDMLAIHQYSSLVLAYGGKRAISHAMPDGYADRFTHDGLRITDKETMEALIRTAPAIGRKLLNGTNAEIISPSVFATAKAHAYDIGFVGEPLRPVDGVYNAIKTGKVPLLSPLGKSYSAEDGYNGLFNCNADAVAAVSSLFLPADEIVFLTNVAGIKICGKVEHYLSASEAMDAIDKGYVTGGMKQKIFYATMPLREGKISHVHIVDGLQPHSLLYALSDKPFHGTVIYR